MRRAGYWIHGIVGILVAGVVVAVLVVDWEGRAEQILGAALGREVRLGSLDIDPGWTTTVRVTDLRVANAEWGEADHFVTLDEGRVAVKVWPLITGQIELPEIVLREPVIALEKDAEGRVNWDFSSAAEAAGEAAKPDERGEFPEIGRLIIEDGRLGYRDAERDLDLDGRIATGKADASGDDTVDLALEGALEGRPLRVDFSGGSFPSLRETERLYPVDFDLRFGETQVCAKGTMTDPVQLGGLDIDFSVEGPTLADVFPIFRIPLPDTPPYSLDGALAKDGNLWKFEKFQGVVGDSDLAGSLSLDHEQDPLFLEADLVSKKLVFEDLAGLVAAEPGDEPKAKQEEETFPDKPIPADRLSAMNMDVLFEGEQVLAPDLPVERLRLRVQVTDGRALVRPLSLKVAGGTVSGEAALNGREAVPSADVDLTFENLDLKPFFGGTQFVRETGGGFSGHAYVLGVGNTVAEMMGTARGQGAIAMREGSISGLIVEAAGLDIAEALVLVIGEDARVKITCGRIDLDVSEGKVKLEQAVIDTTDSLLVGRGVVDLGAETLDVQIEGRAKDFSLIDIAAPVRVHGSFIDPSVAIGGIDPLPFFEMGEEQAVDCDTLVGGAVDKRFDKPKN